MLMKAQELKAIRLALELSQADLAKYLGVTERSVRNYESHEPIPKWIQKALVYLINSKNLNSEMFEGLDHEYLRTLTPKSKIPLGLRPQWVWIEHRVVEIHEAVKRYAEHGLDVPRSWFSELDWLENQQAKSIDEWRKENRARYVLGSDTDTERV